jgi:hypothetical protein
MIIKAGAVRRPARAAVGGLAVAAVVAVLPLVMVAESNTNSADALAGASQATGVQYVTYGGGGFMCTDYLNRSASGIVTEWRPAGGCSPNVDGNSTLLFKPVVPGKPAPSCDQANIIKSVIVTYGSDFGPYTVTSSSPSSQYIGTNDAFWSLGTSYLVCFYPLTPFLDG